MVAVMTSDSMHSQNSASTIGPAVTVTKPDPQNGDSASRPLVASPKFSTLGSPLTSSHSATSPTKIAISSKLETSRIADMPFSAVTIDGLPVKVPALLLACFDYILAGPLTEGVFRVSGSVRRMRLVSSDYTQYEAWLASKPPIHDVAGIVKKCLREYLDTIGGLVSPACQAQLHRVYLGYTREDSGRRNSRRASNGRKSSIDSVLFKSANASIPDTATATDSELSNAVSGSERDVFTSVSSINDAVVGMAKISESVSDVSDVEVEETCEKGETAETGEKCEREENGEKEETAETAEKSVEVGEKGEKSVEVTQTPTSSSATDAETAALLDSVAHLLSTQNGSSKNGLLVYLVQQLHLLSAHESITKMSVANLAIIFQPYIFATQTLSELAPLQGLLSLLVTHYPVFVQKYTCYSTIFGLDCDDLDFDTISVSSESTTSPVTEYSQGSPTTRRRSLSQRLLVFWESYSLPANRSKRFSFNFSSKEKLAPRESPREGGARAVGPHELLKQEEREGDKKEKEKDGEKKTSEEGENTEADHGKNLSVLSSEEGKTLSELIHEQSKKAGLDEESTVSELIQEQNKQTPEVVVEEPKTDSRPADLLKRSTHPVMEAETDAQEKPNDAAPPPERPPLVKRSSKRRSFLNLFRSSSSINTIPSPASPIASPVTPSATSMKLHSSDDLLLSPNNLLAPEQKSLLGRNFSMRGKRK